MVWRILILFLTVSLVHCAHPMRVSRTPWYSKANDTVISCSTLTKSKRQEILELADPDNFYGTRYRKGPQSRRNIEKETDCSTFVHEIYRRAGLPYRFTTTRGLRSAPEFTRIAKNKARPGDLVLYRGHVGILSRSGKIISATKVRSRRQPSSITEYPSEAFGRVRAVLRYQCDDTPIYEARNNVTRPRRSSSSQPN